MIALNYSAAAGFGGFLLAATVGYALSSIRHLPRRGKAFECVQFFYGIIGCSVLVAFVAIKIWG